jgi:hypothetical protein
MLLKKWNYRDIWVGLEITKIKILIQGELNTKMYVTVKLHFL